MKALHSKNVKSVLLSIEEAKILYSCTIEGIYALEDWEYDIKIGVEKERVLRLKAQLKNIIEDSGEWGSPIP